MSEPSGREEVSQSVVRLDRRAVVLLVDDDPGMLLLLRQEMEQAGHHVVIAVNGREALEVYRTASPDIVLLDAIMPVMNGFECCHELCRMPKRVPVLMITALDDAASVRQAFEAGATDYVTKPLNRTVLQQRVQRLIEQSRLMQQVQQFNLELEHYAESCNLLVQERTVLLNRSLEFEAMLRRITDRVRDTLDERQILQTAVQELAWELETGRCNAGVYNPEQGISTVQYEYTASLASYQDRVLQIDQFPEIYNPLLQGEPVQFCSLLPDSQRDRVALFAFPIGSGQTIGDLWLIFNGERELDEMEIRLIQQVANQCAIAIRQARLYEQSQEQVRELEQLNQLKDDFLSTVSHELRTPVTNMRLSIELLERLFEQLQQFSQTVPTLGSIYTKSATYLTILHDACDQEINLINDLLDLQRLETGQQPLNVSKIELQDWLYQEMEPFIVRAQTQQQTLEMNLTLAQLIVETDPAYLRRIVGELVHNACKYSPAGATITVVAQIVGSDDCVEKKIAHRCKFISTVGSQSSLQRYQ